MRLSGVVVYTIEHYGVCAVFIDGYIYRAVCYQALWVYVGLITLSVIEAGAKPVCVGGCAGIRAWYESVLCVVCAHSEMAGR